MEKISITMKSMLPPFPFSELLDWYQKNSRHELPWRNYSFDEKTLGYRVWLAETMLQQTQVERVKLYFINILQAFPTVEDLANTSYEDFFPYYKWLGYYSRARNMLKAAEKVVSDFWGYFPKDVAKLRTLPGVWPYTADAICAFAYDMPTLSFDTNLEKIFARYYFGNKYQKLSKEEKEQIQQDFKKQSKMHQKQGVQGRQDTSAGSVQKSTWPKMLSKSDEEIRSFSCISARDINNALMDYGATISLNATLNINWDKYPLHSSKFYQTRWGLEPVLEKKSSSFPTKQAYVICILHENHKKYFSCPMSSWTWFRINNNDSVSSTEWHNMFSPFLIGKNTGNPRAIIQKYFRENYSLELSVRPPEVKSYNRFEIPYLVCYAQIQSGTHDFAVFEGLKVRGYEESLVEEMEFGERGLF